MIAPFFDDLDNNKGKEPINVYFLADDTSMVIQWNSVANHAHDKDCELDLEYQ